jgi:Family of unknown function (DUF6390)
MGESGTESGKFLHAKHAFQPNRLGYCGPDENSRILDYLHGSPGDEKLVSMLVKFEAAYPFVRMIAKSTGMRPFDKKVTEAYWIGNPLLERVEPGSFYELSHGGLGSGTHVDRMKKEEAKSVFRELGTQAKPHHTFYVLGMYTKPNAESLDRRKLVELMDSCRISWGKVKQVKEKSLVIRRSLLALKDGRLTLGRPENGEVGYDNEIRPMSSLKAGDWVSLHWNFACERLTNSQLLNLKKYTALDIQATNRLADSQRKKQGTR